MEIGTGPSIQQQVEVMKKAADIQERTVTQLLSDSSQQLQTQQQNVQETQKSPGAALTGLGTGIDISA